MLTFHLLTIAARRKVQRKVQCTVQRVIRHRNEKQQFRTTEKELCNRLSQQDNMLDTFSFQILSFTMETRISEMLNLTCLIMILDSNQNKLK